MSHDAKAGDLFTHPLAGALVDVVRFPSRYDHSRAHKGRHDVGMFMGRIKNGLRGEHYIIMLLTFDGRLEQLLFDARDGDRIDVLQGAAL